MAKNVTAEPKAGRSNGYDPEVARGFANEIDNHFRTLDSLRGAYMRDCRGVREEIAGVNDEAKDKGIPKKEFKAVVKARILERKAEKVRDDLDAESVETFDQIRHALGDLADLPLGQAATGDKRAAA
jgi:MoaA/NifB/PqqE/SkfB family radical SAM enzyme